MASEAVEAGGAGGSSGTGGITVPAFNLNFKGGTFMTSSFFSLTGWLLDVTSSGLKGGLLTGIITGLVTTGVGAGAGG